LRERVAAAELIVVVRMVTAIADADNFGRVCLGSFADEDLIIDNGGTDDVNRSKRDFLDLLGTERRRFAFGARKLRRFDLSGCINC
jgi:hypothetical protein